MDTEQLLEILWDCRVETAIFQAQRSDSRYLTAEEIVRKEQKKIENKGLKKEMYQAIDRVISAQNSVGVEFGRLSYCQGFRDCSKLMAEATGQRINKN